MPAQDTPAARTLTEDHPASAPDTGSDCFGASEACDPIDGVAAFLDARDIRTVLRIRRRLHRDLEEAGVALIRVETAIGQRRYRAAGRYLHDLGGRTDAMTLSVRLLDLLWRDEITRR